MQLHCIATALKLNCINLQHILQLLICNSLDFTPLQLVWWCELFLQEALQSSAYIHVLVVLVSTLYAWCVCAYMCVHCAYIHVCTHVWLCNVFLLYDCVSIVWLCFCWFVGVCVCLWVCLCVYSLTAEQQRMEGAAYSSVRYVCVCVRVWVCVCVYVCTRSQHSSWAAACVGLCVCAYNCVCACVLTHSSSVCKELLICV